MQNNLQRHPLAASLGLGGGQGPSGFMRTGADAAVSIPGLSQGHGALDFQDLVAQAQAQAELATQNALMGGPVSQETARSLAQMRAMGLHSEMLAGLDQDGESEASKLVGRMNIEALMSSGQFGNLLGAKGGRPVVDSGRTFSPEQMSSWRQKNEGLRRTGLSGDAEDGALENREANLKMPYGLIRPPARTGRPEEAAPAEPAAPPAAETVRVEGPIKSEAELVAAQKQDAQAAGQNDGFTMEQLDKLVDKVALALNMDPHLVKAVIKTESNFNHKAVSRVGAKGLMQLMPGTAKDLGVEDPFNPVENVWAGARYLKKMLDRHGGNIDKALASYNWGPGNFDRYGKSGKMPGETRRYINVVNQHYASFKKSGTSRA